MSEALHTYSECPVCHASVRASQHTEDECRLTQERDAARRVARRLWQWTHNYSQLMQMAAAHPWLDEWVPEE